MRDFGYTGVRDLRSQAVVLSGLEFCDLPEGIASAICWAMALVFVRVLVVLGQIVLNRSALQLTTVNYLGIVEIMMSVLIGNRPVPGFPRISHSEHLKHLEHRDYSEQMHTVV